MELDGQIPLRQGCVSTDRKGTPTFWATKLSSISSKMTWVFRIANFFTLMALQCFWTMIGRKFENKPFMRCSPCNQRRNSERHCDLRSLYPGRDYDWVPTEILRGALQCVGENCNTWPKTVDKKDPYLIDTRDLQPQPESFWYKEDQFYFGTKQTPHNVTGITVVRIG